MSSPQALFDQIQALTNLVQQQAAQYEQVCNQLEDLRVRMDDVVDPPRQVPPASPLHVGDPIFATKRIKLDLPPMFQGKPSDLAGWLFRVEQYCTVVGITRPTDMVCLAVSRLEKEAFVWWRALTAKGDEFMLGHLMWNDFRSEIEVAFQDIDRELKLRRRLSSLRQTKSVGIYVKEFRNIVIELGNQAPDDSALLFMFTEGLKPEVQLQVMLARPTLLSEAEQLAERADMALFSQHQRRSGGQQQWQQSRFKGKGQFGGQQHKQPERQLHGRQDGPVPMELGAMEGRNSGYNGDRKVRRAIRCYGCGQEGHIKRNCPKSQQSRPTLHAMDLTSAAQLPAEPKN